MKPTLIAFNISYYIDFVLPVELGFVLPDHVKYVIKYSRHMSSADWPTRASLCFCTLHFPLD